MKLEKLQSAWQTHHLQAAAAPSSNLATETITKSVKFEATLWRRDWMETFAAILVIVMFSSTLLTDSLSVMSVLGLLIIIASTFCMIWVLHSARKRQSTIPPDHSLLECARAELQRVEMQIKLLQSITFWYTTPLMVGATLFVFGLLEPWWVALIAAGGFWVIFILVGLLIHRMNQCCIKRSLIPLQEQLLDLIQAFES